MRVIDQKLVAPLQDNPQVLLAVQRYSGPIPPLGFCLRAV